MIDNKIKALWISDIHYYWEYTKFEHSIVLQEAINSFIDTVTGEAKTQPFDYLIFSGDIVQEGTKKDYDAFGKALLKPLLTSLIEVSDCSNTKCLFIPGNHDVKWENSKFLSKYINKVRENKKTSRSDFFGEKDSKQNFENLFCDYTSFLKDFFSPSKNPNFSQFFSFDEPISYKIHQTYVGNYLEGYIIDEKRDIVIVLLNSAWYSLGVHFNKIYTDYLFNSKSFTPFGKKRLQKNQKIKSPFSKHQKKKFTKTELLNFFKTKDNYFSEPNQQITGLNTWDKIYDDLINFLEEYPDYLVITVMHHPLNWLYYNEYYHLKKLVRGNQVAPKLNNILNLTDLFLTGHEHVPDHTNSQITHKDTIHLRSGCFLFEYRNKVKVGNFINDSWFSILDINIQTSSLTQTKFNGENDTWQKMPINTNLPLAKKNNQYSIPEKRLSSLLQVDFSSSSNLDSLLKNIFSNYYIPYNLSLWYSDSIINIFLPSNKTAAYIVPLKISFYNEIINSQDILLKIEDLVTENSKLQDIHFINLDLLISDNGAKHLYSSSGESSKIPNRNMLFNSIMKLADNQFDDFRSKFFSRFETGSKDEMNRVKKFATVRFINNVIPYWKFSKSYLND